MPRYVGWLLCGTLTSVRPLPSSSISMLCVAGLSVGRDVDDELWFPVAAAECDSPMRNALGDCFSELSRRWLVGFDRSEW